MDAVILAGGVPQLDDPLYALTQGKPKALLDIAGRPMAQWVLDALTEAAGIAHIILVGLGAEAGLLSPKLAAALPDQGSLLRNVIGGIDRALEISPGDRQVLVGTADIPLITGAMVDEFLAQCADPAFDIHYGTVRRPLMEGRFPESRRTYVHLTDGDLAGADVFVINPEIAYTNRQLWDDLIGRRKSPLRQAMHIGLGTLVRLLLGRLSLAEAERRVTRAMGLTGRAVLVKHAELGMDVDKPFQLEICRQELAAR
jgi:molybdopterin-guanine dinucleotide biosynthesis protein A